MRTALIVGGTGMLGAASVALAERGLRIGLVARRASAFAPDLTTLERADANWSDRTAYLETIRGLIDRLAPVDLRLIWTHDRPRGLALDIAEALAERGGARCFYHVMGSAVSDPAHPETLIKARGAFEAVLPGAWRPICLGFVIEGDASRWLTKAEISAGVLEAIDKDLPEHKIGSTRPWSKKP